MTKKFCDICGEPAEGKYSPPELLVKNGEPRETFESDGLGFKTVCQQIGVLAHFSLRNHPTGFGGPPDLCAKCRGELLHALAAKYADASAKV